MLLHKIRGLCEAQGISIAELERKANINQRTIYKWDKVIPAADKLARVAEILGTTVEALLEGCDGKSNQG